MKIILSLLVGIVIGVSLASVFFYYTLYDMHALEEVKICIGNLEKEPKGEVQPQLREYLKVRLYWNALVNMRYRSDFFSESMKLDYGPVNQSILGSVSGIKDPISPDEVYRGAIQKFKK